MLYDDEGCVSSCTCGSLINRKKELLSREDLELQWRPLHELHDRILFSKTEHLGLNWFPKYGYVLFFLFLFLKASLGDVIIILFINP